ncbi:MAG: hypothetical protein M3314_07455 [Actinomycetota bacterium]|nr:hypothetical protein [Actinomycetota bacterium]
MRPRQSPLCVLLLVPAGVLAGHALGYAGASHVHGGAAATAGHSHGYLAAAAAVATLLAVLALAGVAMARPAASRVSFRTLLTLQWGSLLVQEGVEHAVAGEPVVTLLSSFALWLSLAGQLVAAAGAALLVASARVVGGRLAALTTDTGSRFVLSGAGLVVPPPDPVRSLGAAGALLARGPPPVSA